jgi:hypothetical protein
MSKTFVIVTALVVILLKASTKTLPGIYAQNDSFIGKQLGEFKIVDVAGIPHLEDKNGFLVFPAFCPTACTADWSKSKGGPGAPGKSGGGGGGAGINATNSTSSTSGAAGTNATGSASNNSASVSRAKGQTVPVQQPAQPNIGAIKVEFTQPGVYSFSYFLKPLIGEFLNLPSLQIITIPFTDKGNVPLKEVSWYHYNYNTQGTSQFKIPSPGTYIIAFGPAKGSALTKLEAQGIPSGFTLKYKIGPSQNVKITQSDMDLQYIQQDGRFLYKTIGYGELTKYTNLYQLERWAQNGIKELGVSKKVSHWLLVRGANNTLVGGSNLRYPIGRNADYAVMRINEFMPLLQKMTLNGDLQTAKLTTAKLLTYILTIREDATKKNVAVPEAKYQEAEKLWTSGDYKEFLSLAAQIAKEVLPNTFPEWQKTSASYGQVKYLINSIENAT